MGASKFLATRLEGSSHECQQMEASRAPTGSQGPPWDEGRWASEGARSTFCAPCQDSRHLHHATRWCVHHRHRPGPSTCLPAPLPVLVCLPALIHAGLTGLSVSFLCRSASREGWPCQAAEWQRTFQETPQDAKSFLHPRVGRGYQGISRSCKGDRGTSGSSGSRMPGARKTSLGPPLVPSGRVILGMQRRRSPPQFSLFTVTRLGPH